MVLVSACEDGVDGAVGSVAAALVLLLAPVPLVPASGAAGGCAVAAPASNTQGTLCVNHAPNLLAALASEHCTLSAVCAESDT